MNTNFLKFYVSFTSAQHVRCIAQWTWSCGITIVVFQVFFFLFSSSHMDCFNMCVCCACRDKSCTDLYLANWETKSVELWPCKKVTSIGRNKTGHIEICVWIRTFCDTKLSSSTIKGWEGDQEIDGKTKWKRTQQKGMEEAPKNSKESSHSAHANEWMNEWMKPSSWILVIWCFKTLAWQTKL